MYKLLLFDLDGTLLTDSREIGPANLSTLTRLMQKGIRVGLATGRSYRSVSPYVETLKPNGPLILFNGARVWDLSKSEFIYRNDLSFDQAFRALELVREFDDVHVNLYVEHDILISKKTDRSRESEIKDGVPHTVVGDLANWLEAHPCQPIKIMLISEPAILDEFENEYKLRVRSPVSLIHSEWNYLEIMQAGVNKGQTLKRIARHFNVGCEEIVSFGDNLNDLDLIRFSGLGVAMGNAHDELKAVARRTIGHHQSDAIHEFLSEIFNSYDSYK